MRAVGPLFFCNDFHVSENIAAKIAYGFGAGMGRKQEVCGAVTGGIVVIGLKYGGGTESDPTAKELVYAKTRAFMDAFAAKQGSYICRELVNGCDLTSEEGQKRFKENDLLRTTCRACVKGAVEILEGMV